MLEVSIASCDRAIVYTPQLPVVAGKAVEGYGGTGRMMVRGRPDTLWDVMVDFARHPQIFTAVRAGKILKAEATSAVVMFDVDGGFLTIRYAARYVFDATNRMIQWQMVPHEENNLKSNAGDVHLEEVSPGWTQVIYSVGGDLKGTWFVPAFLKRFLAKREILRAMRDLRCYIEEQRTPSP